MADDERIRVRARDGEELEWSHKAARRSGMFKHLMDDAEDGVYPAPLLPAATLARLGAICEPDYAPTEDLGMLSVEELVRLIEGAVYLDVAAEALEHIQRAVASRLAAKHGVELRELLSAADDFDSESDRTAALAEPFLTPEMPIQTAASGSEGPFALLRQPSFWVPDDAMATALRLVDVGMLVELKGVNPSWQRLARRVLFARLCRIDAQLALSEVTDVDAKMLHDAGRVWEATRLSGLERLHWDDWQVDVAAVQTVDLAQEDEEDEDEEDEDEDEDETEVGEVLSHAATAALRGCVMGEGIPPPELLLVAIVCAGSGEVCGVPVEEMRSSSLTELDLHCMDIGPVATKLVACLIPLNADLTSLNLLGNSLKDEGITAICEALQSNDGSKLTSLTISLNDVGSVGANSVAAMMAVCTELTSVNLLRNDMDMESATALVAVAKEKGISLCGIAPEQTEADFTGRRLGLVDGILVASDLFVCAELTTLNLKSNNIGGYWDSDQMKVISTPEGPKAIADALLGTAELTVIDMRYNELDTESATMLANIAKDKNISLCGIKPGQTVADFSQSATVCFMKHADAILLSADLFVRTELTSLDLRFNALGPNGAAALAPGLAASAELTKIWLGYNSLGDEGTRTLCNALSESKVSKLQELDLSSNDIGPPSTKALSDMLLVCADPTSLNLSSNRLGPAGAEALAPALVKASLTSLNLHSNSLKDEGITAICEALQSNDGSKLISFTISFNDVGLVGAKSVAAMLAVCASLTRCEVRGNRLDDEAKALLRQAVEGRAGFDLQPTSQVDWP